MRRRWRSRSCAGFPPMMANLHISALVKPLQEEHDGPNPAVVADPVSGGGGGAADCLRKPGGTDAGKRDPAAKRDGGAAGAGSEGVGAAAAGNSGKSGAELSGGCSD